MVQFFQWFLGVILTPLSRIKTAWLPVLAALSLSLLLPGMAQASDKHPKIGSDIHPIGTPSKQHLGREPNPKSAYFAVPTTANLDTRALFELLGTDLESFRADNVGVTIPLCMTKLGGYYSPNPGARKSEAAWDGCPNDRRYLYVVPGSIIEVSDLKMMPRDTIVDVGRALLKCRGKVPCVNDKIQAFGLKPVYGTGQPAPDPADPNSPPPPPPVAEAPCDQACLLAKLATTGWKPEVKIEKITERVEVPVLKLDDCDQTCLMAALTAAGWKLPEPPPPPPLRFDQKYGFLLFCLVTLLAIALCVVANNRGNKLDAANHRCELLVKSTKLQISDANEGAQKATKAYEQLNAQFSAFKQSSVAVSQRFSQDVGNGNQAGAERLFLLACLNRIANAMGLKSASGHSPEALEDLCRSMENFLTTSLLQLRDIVTIGLGVNPKFIEKKPLGDLLTNSVAFANSRREVLSSLRTEKEDAENGKAQAEKERDQAKAECNQAQARVTQLQGESAQLQAQVTAKSAENDSLRAANESLTTENTGVKALNAELELARNEALALNAQLRTTNVQHEAKLERLGKECDQLQTKAEEACVNMQAARDEADALQQANAQLQIKVDSLEPIRELSNIVQTICTNAKSVSELRETITKLEKERAELSTLVKEGDEEIAPVSQRIDNGQHSRRDAARFSSASQILIERTKKVHALTRKIAVKSASLESAKQEYLNATQLFEQLTRIPLTRMTAQMQADEQVTKADEQLAGLLESIASLQAREQDIRLREDACINRELHLGDREAELESRLQQKLEELEEAKQRNLELDETLKLALRPSYMPELDEMSANSTSNSEDSEVRRVNHSQTMPAGAAHPSMVESLLKAIHTFLEGLKAGVGQYPNLRIEWVVTLVEFVKQHVALGEEVLVRLEELRQKGPEDVKKRLRAEAVKRITEKDYTIGDLPGLFYEHPYLFGQSITLKPEPLLAGAGE